MNNWTVHYIDGKIEKFVTEPQGIQIIQPDCPVLIVHRTLGQSPIFLNMLQVKKWHADAAPTLGIVKP